MTLISEKISRLSSLQCAECSRPFSIEQPNTFATCDTCGKNPLIAKYELSGVQKNCIKKEERSMWRYFELLPVFQNQNIVSLGEGWTPLLKLEHLAALCGVENILMKDESLNPTGSFKARGLSAAISKVKEFGISNCIVPTAGNAGGAMAAYCAHAGIKATVVMPTHTPKAFKQECQFFAANLILVDGFISDCAKKVTELNKGGEYFDLSTMKEPYRLEGKKTMGYEIAEQLQWNLPDVIFYPTGGGTGLIGMWKAFHEMIEAGWITDRMPKFIAVQSENCQPVVETFLEGAPSGKYIPTIANGLAVPTPFAWKLIQRVLHESSGSAIAISEFEIAQGVKEIAKSEGILVAPEGGALLAALKKTLRAGIVQREDKILFLNTGSGYKYLENLIA